MTIDTFFFETLWGYALMRVPFLLLGGALYLIVRCIAAMIRDQPLDSFRWECPRTLTALWYAGLLCVLVVPSWPFEEFWHFVLDHAFSGEAHLWQYSLEVHWVPVFWRNFLGDTQTLLRWVRQVLVRNVLPFAPLGFLFTLTKVRSAFWRVLLWGLGSALLFEILNLAVGRPFVMDDLLWNLVSFVLGLGICKLLSLPFRSARAGARLAEDEADEEEDQV